MWSDLGEGGGVRGVRLGDSQSVTHTQSHVHTHVIKKHKHPSGLTYKRLPLFSIRGVKSDGVPRSVSVR